MAAASTKEEFNRDIYPSKEFVASRPGIAPLIENKAIQNAFAVREKAAVWWKRRYVWLGRTSLVCILVVALLLAYRLTLAGHYGEPAPFGLFAALFGAIGLLAQLALMLAGAKDRWLIERFGAERLRCLKFQAFMLLARHANAANLNADVERHTRQVITSLDQELRAGRSAFTSFSPSAQPIETFTESEDQPPSDLVRDAIDAYKELRLKVQRQHFKARAEQGQERKHIPATIGEIAFIIGALLALFEMTLAGWHLLDSSAWQMPPLIQAWLQFLTLAMFSISAIVAVYQRGAGDQVDVDRYIHYGREIDQLDARSQLTDRAALLATVKDMEELALRELHDFCRDAQRSNFIF